MRDRTLLGASAVLAVAVPVGLHRVVDARAERDLAPRLTALTGVASQIGGVEAGLTGTIRLTDVAIGPLFEARALEARIALSSLLAGQLSADEIRVEAPRLRARMRDGELDLATVVHRIAARRTTGAPATNDNARRVRRIVVTGGELVVDAGPITLAARDVELHPQTGGVRVVTGRLRVRGKPDLGRARLAIDAT